jgi:hypothetical protein
MPLNKELLKTKMAKVFKDRFTAILYKMQSAKNESEISAIFSKLGEDVANLVDDYIKSATIIVNPGQIVTANVGGVVGSGATTTNGTTKIS